MRKTHPKNSSFTLIELLIVIIIVGILATISTVSTTSYISSAQNIKILAEVSNMSRQLLMSDTYPVGTFCIEDEERSEQLLLFLEKERPPVHPLYPKNFAPGEIPHEETDNCFLYASNGTDYSIRVPALGGKGYYIQEAKYPKVQDIQKTCEPGWIPIGNRCVMQYEAKAKVKNGTALIACDTTNNICSPNTHEAVSAPGVIPWTYITQDDAIKACQNIGAHLMTNAEWMAIAMNIEKVDENWHSGVLKQGKTGEDISYISYGGAGLDTGNPTLATLKLTNGQEIYHFSGNVAEWVDDRVVCKSTRTCPGLPGFNKSASFGDGDFGYYEFNSINDDDWGKYVAMSIIGSINKTYTSTKGIGKIFIADTVVGSFNSYDHRLTRGGSLNDHENAGIYNFNLNNEDSKSDNFTGFRCVR